MDLLAEIIKRKALRLAEAKQSTSLADIREAAEVARRAALAHRLRAALKRSGVNIIAEFKRRSPSKGEINAQARPEEMARAYETGGAAAISVLTEQDFFAGSLDDLRAIRKTSRLPILRKDFIFDDYQVYESAAAGADALLLIVTALDASTLTRLRTLAEVELGMDALVEVHTRPELDMAIQCGAQLIGVNNRDLKTFKVSTETSIELAGAAPKDVTLVSESGLTGAAIELLQQAGYKGFLIGQTLMSAKDPASVLSSFVSQTNAASKTVLVKICGITSLEDARAAVQAGADMLGFNFYRASPRFIEPDHARSIIDELRSDFGGTRTKMVGVFVDESSPTQLVQIAERTGIDAIQLHGDHSSEFCAAVKNLLPKVTLIRVVRVHDQFDRDEIDGAADALMLDTFHSELRGGTGRSFDWRIARQARAVTRQLFLAGGLSPENVAEAIAEVQPYAVDACSSLELSPGRKDAGRMKEFVRAARRG